MCKATVNCTLHVRRFNETEIKSLNVADHQTEWSLWVMHLKQEG